jgi:hypothetical protein
MVVNGLHADALRSRNVSSTVGIGVPTGSNPLSNGVLSSSFLFAMRYSGVCTAM